MRRALPATVLAAISALVATLAGWRGGDLPAQRYRVELFRAHGFAVWDSQWFGGHWVPDYSVLFPAVAATVGLSAVSVVAAAVAAGCFGRLVDGRLPSPRAASVVFAVGVVVQVAIGQLDFLAGEAAGMACLLAMATRRWRLAAGLALLTALLAPLAAAFVAIAGAAVWLRAGRKGRGGAAGVVAAAVAPLLVVAVAFPSSGVQPFPFADWFWEVGVAAGAALAAGRGVLRTGLVLYLLALTGAFAVQSPLGGNIGRAEDIAALPLAFGLWWGHKRLRLAAMVVPLTLSEWAPAWPAMTTDPASRWTAAAAYTPLARWLSTQGGPAGRVEVVPTFAHYETSSLAPGVALARGWERQLDEADAPLFYGRAPLTAGRYLDWLRASGVRWVAQPDAPLDTAGVAEARLLRAGVPGLQPAWPAGAAVGWQVWSVTGSPGIAPAGVQVLGAGGGQVRVAVPAAGRYRLAERWNPDWAVTSGPATVGEAAGGWVELRARAAGTVVIEVRWP